MIQGYISRLIFNKNLLVSTGVFIFHNPPLTPWAWGEYFFMLRGEIMKNWTSKKATFLIILDTFYQQIH